MVVPDEHDQKRHDSEQNPHELLCKKRQARSALIVSHTVNGKHTDRQNGKDQAEESQVEAVEPPAVHHPVNHGAPTLATCVGFGVSVTVETFPVFSFI